VSVPRTLLTADEAPQSEGARELTNLPVRNHSLGATRQPHPDTVWWDSEQSSAPTSAPSSGTSADWAALPAGNAADVSPAFLAAMKRMSTSSQEERTSHTPTQPLRPRRRYSDRSGPTHDPTLVSDEPDTSFNPYRPREREVNPYATESYGDISVRPDTREMGRAGPAEPRLVDSPGLRMRKSWEKMREAVGLVDPDKEIAKVFVREGWEGFDEWRGASTERGRTTSPVEFRKKHEKKGSITSVFSLGGRKPKDRRGIPPMEPLHVPADREERIAMGPTLAHTPREWKMNDGHITRMRAASPAAESLRCGIVDERTRRGESPPGKDGTVRRLVRRASGRVRRSLSKMSLASKKSTENLTGEDFFLPAPQGLGPARPERHSCYLACASTLREDVHKFDECFCDCPGCRPQERRRPMAGQ
jgi:hypothetical protein